LVGIGRYFLEENSVSIFGIKTLAGAPQKIGGSPLFPKKGGPRPPFCKLHPPFEEKKEFPRNFSKKKFPRNLKKVFPPKLTVLPFSGNCGHLGGFLLFFLFKPGASYQTQRHKDKQRLPPPVRSIGTYSISPRPMVLRLDRRLNPHGGDCRAHAAKAIFP
jgi:hypothetical protein